MASQVPTGRVNDPTQVGQDVGSSNPGLSAELRRLRFQKQVSQKVVAEELRVRRETVTQWESGRFPPAMDKVRKLDDYYGADGALVALADADRWAAAEPATVVATTMVGPERGLSLADAFEAIGRALVRGIVTDPDDAHCVGWSHSVGRGSKPTPWSTAIGIRTLQLLDRADVDLELMARTVGGRQRHGGWSNRELDVPRPEVTALVLDALSCVGGGGADLEAAWTWLRTSINPEDRERPYVLSTVLECVARLRPDSPLVRGLVDDLLAARAPYPEGPLWSANPAAVGLVEPSIVHTARAVVALRSARAAAERDDVVDAVGRAVQWIVDSDRGDDGVTEVLRIDPRRRALDVPIDHFTSAFVVRALAGSDGVPPSRLAAALTTLWDSYVPAEGLWAWKHDGRLPVWMTYDSVSALRAHCLASVSSPITPTSGDFVDPTPGGSPRPPAPRRRR